MVSSFKSIRKDIKNFYFFESLLKVRFFLSLSSIDSWCHTYELCMWEFTYLLHKF